MLWIGCTVLYINGGGGLAIVPDRLTTRLAQHAGQVAAPIAFDRVLPGLQVRSDARDLASMLREARGQAIRDNREATATIDVEERTYRLGDDGELQRFSGRIQPPMKGCRR